ncbi:ring-10 protein [Fusarium flagelliforme]|uniref:Ring-10 protein n=1 Tax=Fusarium flagelliforme TaxID=2675880 RepID=A0A395M8Z5_9HYPO|nr:ring-10 protein [Fusarium flagelliforme]
MPSYFYHIKFELYPTPDPVAAAQETTEHKDIWLPLSEASVFDDSPSHPRPDRRTIYRVPNALESPSYSSANHTSPYTTAGQNSSTSSLGIIDCGAATRPPVKEPEKNIEILSERQWLERANSFPPPHSSVAIHPQNAVRDWRFGRVGLETVDLRTGHTVMGEASRSTPSAAPSLGPTFGGAGTATKADFLPLETKNTELGWGVVHFYRDGDETPSLVESGGPENGIGDSRDNDCTTLCIPAVPAYMSPGDLMGFVGEKWRSGISHCRMVMTSRMNRYLVLLKFRDNFRAKQWRQEFDGKVFNTMEPQICHVVFVKTITFEIPTRKTSAALSALTSSAGCGRYKGGHAKDHWKETAHCFALELETQHVWDYAGDMWVHRLIRDKGDGKVVELPSRNRSVGHLEEEDVVPRAKLESIGLEYTHLVTSQLESQRAYYEELISKTVDKASKASATAENAAAQASKAMEKLALLEEKYTALSQATIPELEKQLERERNKASKSEMLARNLGKSLQEEKRLNEGLMKRIEHLNTDHETMAKELNKIKTENAELQEMNRDLSMFISGQEKLKELENEGKVDLEGSSASVPEKKNRRRKR